MDVEKTSFGFFTLLLHYFVQLRSREKTFKSTHSVLWNQLEQNTVINSLTIIAPSKSRIMTSWPRFQVFLWEFYLCSLCIVCCFALVPQSQDRCCLTAQPCFCLHEPDVKCFFQTFTSSPPGVYLPLSPSSRLLPVVSERREVHRSQQVPLSPAVLRPPLWPEEPVPLESSPKSPGEFQ